MTLDFNNAMGGSSVNRATTEGVRISKLRQKISGYLGTDAVLDVTWTEEGLKRPLNATMIPSQFVGRDHILFKCGTQVKLSDITQLY